jgi:hypothetical protein
MATRAAGRSYFGGQPAPSHVMWKRASAEDMEGLNSNRKQAADFEDALWFSAAFRSDCFVFRIAVVRQ